MDFQQFLKIQKFLFKLMKLNFFSTDTPFVRRFCKLCLLFHLFAMVFLTIPTFIFIRVNIKDIVYVSEAFGPLTTCWITFFKTLTFYMYETKIERLTDAFKGLFENSSISEQTMMRGSLVLDQKFTKIVITVVVITGIGYVTVPILEIIITYVSEHKMICQMPFKAL